MSHKFKSSLKSEKIIDEFSSGENWDSDNFKNSSLNVKPKVVDPPCICNRPKTRIVCKRCGWILENGRAHRTCETHPKRFHLSDMSQCPECRATAKFLNEEQA